MISYIRHISLSTLSILLIFFVFASCKNKMEEVNQVSSTDALPMQSAKNIDLLYTENGKRNFILSGKVMRRFVGEKSYTEYPEGIKIRFFDENEKVKSQLTAKYGIWNEDDKIKEVKDCVVVINFEKEQRLETEHLIWDETKKLIYTEKFVTITEPDRIQYGMGFEANETFSSFIIRKPTGSYQFKNNEF